MGKLIKKDEAPRQAALAFLPFLFSNPPFIPASSTSSTLNQRHQILGLSPEDVEEYLITNTYPTDYPTATRSVELLRLLTSQVENVNLDQDSVVGRIRYKCPEKNSILVGVELGNSSSPLLLLLLKLEGDEKESDSYKYDNLLPMNVVPGPWFASLEEAARFEESSLQLFQTLSRAFPDDSTEEGKEMNGSGSYHEELPVESLSHDTEEQGNGEYITDADEFWAGFDSDEEEGNKRNAEQGGILEVSEEDRQRKEDRYWEMYDQQGPASTNEIQEELDLFTSRRNNGNPNIPSASDNLLNNTKRKMEEVKAMMKDAWRLLNNASVSIDGSNEDDFLQLAREAVQECGAEMNAFGNK